jgi:hypothetical protein
MSNPDPSLVGDSDSNDSDSVRLMDEGFSSSGGSDSDDDDVVIDNVDPALLKNVKSIVIKDESDSGDDSDSSSLSGEFIVYSSDDDEENEESNFDANLIEFENDDKRSRLVAFAHKHVTANSWADILKCALGWTDSALESVTEGTKYVDVVSTALHCTGGALETDTVLWYQVLHVMADSFCTYCNEHRTLLQNAAKGMKMRSINMAIHAPIPKTGGKVLQVYTMKFDINLAHRKTLVLRNDAHTIHKVVFYAVLSKGNNVFFHIKEEVEQERNRFEDGVNITPKIPLRPIIDSGHASKQPARKYPEVVPTKNPHRTRSKLSSCMDQTGMAQTGIAQTGVDQRRSEVDALDNLATKQATKFEQRKQIKEAAIKAARSKKSSTKKSSVNEAVNEAVITEAATKESAISNQPRNQHQNHITFM